MFNQMRTAYVSDVDLNMYTHIQTQIQYANMSHFQHCNTPLLYKHMLDLLTREN